MASRESTPISAKVLSIEICSGATCLTSARAEMTVSASGSGMRASLGASDRIGRAPKKQ